MQLYVILAQHESTARALEAWLQAAGEGHPDAPSPALRIIAPQAPGMSVERSLGSFETLSTSLSRVIEERTGHIGGGCCVLVDAINPSALDACAETPSWEALIAMLILTFPDVHFVFGACHSGALRNDPRAAQWAGIRPHHTLTGLAGVSRCPLFDPTGLRQWVLDTTNRTLRFLNERLIVRRPALAAAIDEERPFALLHGYTAYRFGFRTDVVTSWAQMHFLFGGQSHAYDLLLEDVSLKFPDRPGNVVLSDFEARSDALVSLDSRRADRDRSRYRIAVTSGHHVLSGESIERNERYLADKVSGRGRAIYKPAGGMFDIWYRAGLSGRGGARDLADAAVSGFAESSPASAIVVAARSRAHGTPGRLLRIVEALIRRAETLSDVAANIESAVVGAVLSGDALDLSGRITPTTAVNALVLKQRFEVEIECQFSGVEYHFDIASRLAEVEREADLISKASHQPRQKTALLNTEMRVIHALLAVLRAHGQFDEEQLCLARARLIHLRLWLSKSSLRYLVAPPLFYIVFLMSSPLDFALVILLWVEILTLSFKLCSATAYSLNASLGDAISSFFSLGAPVANPETVANAAAVSQWPYTIVVYVSILAGFIHLGTFVSYIYSVASRK